jgi:hypothetical protein
MSQLHPEETFLCVIESIMFTRCLQTVHKYKGEFEWYRKYVMSQEHSKLKCTLLTRT